MNSWFTSSFIFCLAIASAVGFVIPARGGRPLTSIASSTLDLTLEKPLGIILEEVKEGEAAGVFVADFAESGSALEHSEAIAGATLATVQGMDVTSMDFDSIMGALIDAPPSVALSFVVKGDQEEVTDYPVGTYVTVTFVTENGLEVPMECRVGDNLRQAMLDNKIEVYQGMKQKLGNCGGGGSCTFCAVDIIESDGWPSRSDYEDQKLSKFPAARLACLNPIQGPAKIRKTSR